MEEEDEGTGSSPEVDRIPDSPFSDRPSVPSDEEMELHADLDVYALDSEIQGGSQTFPSISRKKRGAQPSLVVPETQFPDDLPESDNELPPPASRSAKQASRARSSKASAHGYQNVPPPLSLSRAKSSDSGGVTSFETLLQLEHHDNSEVPRALVDLNSKGECPFFFLLLLDIVRWKKRQRACLDGYSHTPLPDLLRQSKNTRITRLACF